VWLGIVCDLAVLVFVIPTAAAEAMAVEHEGSIYTRWGFTRGRHCEPPVGYGGSGGEAISRYEGSYVVGLVFPDRRKLLGEKQ